MAHLEGAVKRDYFLIDPSATRVELESGKVGFDPLYNDAESPPEWLVLSLIRAGGNEQPVVAARVGDQNEPTILAGRKRRKSMIEANRRLVAEGKEPLKLKLILKPLKPGNAYEQAAEVRRLENAARVELTPLQKAEYVAELYAAGWDEATIAESGQIGTASPGEVRALRALLENGSDSLKAAVANEEISVTAAAKLAEGIAPAEQAAKLEELKKSAPVKGKSKGKVTVRQALDVVTKKKRGPNKATAGNRRVAPVIVQTLITALQEIPAMEGGKEFHKAAEALSWSLGECETPGWIRKLLDKAGAVSALG